MSGKERKRNEVKGNVRTDRWMMTMVEEEKEKGERKKDRRKQEKMEKRTGKERKKAGSRE